MPEFWNCLAKRCREEGCTYTQAENTSRIERLIGHELRANLESAFAFLLGLLPHLLNAWILLTSLVAGLAAAGIGSTAWEALLSLPAIERAPTLQAASPAY